MHLRQVVLSDDKTDFGLGNATLLSWGSFPIDNLDAVVIHPSNAVLACSFSKHKLFILQLPDGPSPDAQARQAKMISGYGLREGLVKGPKALAVAPDGRILVLESLNNRVQAFSVKGTAVPSFTPQAWIFTVTTAAVTAKLDQVTVPPEFTNGLIQQGNTYVASLPDSGYTQELDGGALRVPLAKIDGGKLRAVNDADRPPTVIEALATRNIQLSYDPAQMQNPKLSAQIRVVTPGQSWIITDPRQHAWHILNQSGMLNVYERPVRIEVEVQKPGNRWMLTDDFLGRAWVLQVANGDPTLVEVFECFTYFPLQKGPNDANLNYLDMAVEAQGYMYILSYMNDGSSTTDYLLDVYGPDGTFVFRSPDATKTTRPQNIVAGRITVDVFRNLFALPYETLRGPGGGLQPGLAHWTPTPPLFDLPLTEQPNFNAKNISAVAQGFQGHKIPPLSNQAFIEVVNPDGWWQVKDGNTIYNVYRSNDKLEVYSIPA